MAKRTAVMTVAELERMLNARRTALQELNKRRARVKAELDKIDAEIRALSGGLMRKRSGRSRNKFSLREIVVDLLKRSKKGYSLADLTQIILDSGYKTGSTNFRNVLYQCLYNQPAIYYDEAAGTYRYKEPPARHKHDSAK
jgi:hypothetical protein